MREEMIHIFLLILTFWLAGWVNVEAKEENPYKRLDVQVNVHDVAVQRFLGFGAEWDPGFWDEYNLELGVTEKDWKEIVRRVRWMKMPTVRVMMHIGWVYREGKEGFDWNSDKMHDLYRLLDACMEEKIVVILTDWGLGERDPKSPWKRVRGIEYVSDPKYAEIIGAYMDYLVNEKGYSVIKYFVLVNEPNLETLGWDEWKRGVENIAKIFAKKSLDKKVRIMGPDVHANMQWLRDAVDQLPNILDAYDIHHYPGHWAIQNGKCTDYVRKQIDYIRQNDVRGANKPFCITEAGVEDGKDGPGKRKNCQVYEYGVDMADYAVQATTAGADAVLAWMLDDSMHNSMHKGSNLGMWKDKKGEFALKPWFYAWSLLTRYVPEGSTIYRTLPGDENVRVLVSSISPQTETGQDSDWTVVIVNRGTENLRLRIRIPGAEHLTFAQYLYASSSITDDNGRVKFPEPVSEVTPGNKAIEIDSPSDSVVLITSVQHQ